MGGAQERSLKVESGTQKNMAVQGTNWERENKPWTPQLYPKVLQLFPLPNHSCFTLVRLCSGCTVSPGHPFFFKMAKLQSLVQQSLPCFSLKACSDQGKALIVALSHKHPWSPRAQALLQAGHVHTMWNAVWHSVNIQQKLPVGPCNHKL